MALGGIDPAAALADHHHQLGFMLDLLGLRRQEDGLLGADHRGGRFEEEQGHIGYLGIVFFGMLDIIAPDADDLAGEHRRKQAHCIQRDARPPGGGIRRRACRPAGRLYLRTTSR